MKLRSLGVENSKKGILQSMWSRFARPGCSEQGREEAALPSLGLEFRSREELGEGMVVVVGVVALVVGVVALC